MVVALRVAPGVAWVTAAVTTWRCISGARGRGGGADCGSGAGAPVSGRGLETSRAALRYGYESVRDYLARPDSAELRRRFAAPPARSEWAPRAEPAT